MLNTHFLRNPFIPITFIFCFLLFSIADAADYETPHTFKPGDVISADVMNEIFQMIDMANSGGSLTTGDIVGTYDCTHYMTKGNYINDSSWESYPGWLIQHLTMDADNLMGTRSDTLTVFDDGDGTYSYQTKNYNSFTMYPSGEPNSPGPRNPLTIKGSAAMLKVNDLGTTVPVLYLFKKASATQIIFTYTGSTNTYVHWAVCNTCNVPPAIPTNLSATISSPTVTLSWTDNSGDETGFKIIRKDTLTGAFNQIGTTSANVTSYSDTLSAAGTYWYRVKATNANGDSLGSDEVKVTVVD